MESNNVDCGEYPECGCTSSCRSACASIDANSEMVVKHLNSMVQRLNGPQLFETIKSANEPIGCSCYPECGCHTSCRMKNSATMKAASGWEKQEVECIPLGPVTQADKKALEESDWHPYVEVDPSELKKDALGMQELLDIYQEMQKEENEDVAADAKLAEEKMKKANIKAVLLVYCNVGAFIKAFPNSKDGSAQSYMDKTTEKFTKILPETIAVVSVPICSGEDRIEVIHLS